MTACSSQPCRGWCSGNSGAEVGYDAEPAFPSTDAEDRDGGRTDTDDAMIDASDEAVDSAEDEAAGADAADLE